MPRPKKFNTEDLTAAATDLFWEKGYSNVSFDDLVQVTGVSRRGIYDTYGGKRGLFLACLEYYRELLDKEVYKEFGKGETGREGLLTFYRRLEGNLLLASRSCLFLKSSNEFGASDEEVFEFLENQRSEFMERQSKACAAVLDWDDPEQQARLLFFILQGILSSILSGSDSKVIDSGFESVFSLIEG